MKKKNIIITGATSGIGKALTYNFNNISCNLGLIGRNSVKLKKLSTTVKNEVFYKSVDVTKKNELDKFSKSFLAKFGEPDIVIANAGISHGTSILENDEKTFVKIIDTNLIGMMYTFSVFVNAMKEKKKGILVGISSVAGIRGIPGSSAYCASKGAVNNYLESLRFELKSSGISVINISPGFVYTPMTKNNSFKMPFIMEADTAAKKIIKVIEKNKIFFIMPWQMRLIAPFLRIMPQQIFNFIMNKFPKKPRKFKS